MDAPHDQHTFHRDHHHQLQATTTNNTDASPSRLHPHGNEVSTVRRGLKRPAQHIVTTTTRSGRERKWAKHCGCSGPCQAALFDEDDECEDLELEALENLLKRRREDQEPSSRFRGRACSDNTDSSSASVSSSIVESDCESQPESKSSPPQLLHFLLMF